jgi:dihydroorotate dehydrogenase electron transfer subunit
MGRSVSAMRAESARVVRHRIYAAGYRELVLRAPKCARSARPGQFIHLLIPRLENAVLRRPFSIFGAKGAQVRILYKCVGRGTEALARVSVGESVSVLGPLGNGFPVTASRAVPVFVAGGYGVAPLRFLAERMRTRGTVFIGGRTSADILCAADFRKLGWRVEVATEDGSEGVKGWVTHPLDAWLSRLGKGKKAVLFACGPDGMLKAVGTRALAQGLTAWLSLDKHMGCGVGACLACVQRIRLPDGREHWARVCRDGPIFEAREVVWGAPNAR